MHRRRSAPGVLSVGLLALLLSGCDPDQPTAVETPAIVWESGHPDQDDEFEAVFREYGIGYAVAFNARDFTVEQLTATTTADRVEAIYEAFRSQYLVAGADPRVYAGPIPYSVIEVVPHGDGSATLSACYPLTEWWIEADHPDPEIDVAAAGQSATVSIGRVDGVLKVIDVDATVDACEAEEVVLGRFDPVPEPPASIGERDIRPPLTVGR